MTIPENIRELRGRMSRRIFAELIGINQQTIYDYEKGRCTPSPKQLKKIAEKLNVSEDWIKYGDKEFTENAHRGNLVVQHNNQGNNVGITLGNSFLDGKKQENEAVVTCQRCIELENTIREKDGVINELQTELSEMQKKYMKLLEKMAGV